MPKMKTNKSASKRLTRSARGKLRFRRPGRGHLLSCKSRKRKRALRKDGILHASAVKGLRGMIVP
jgi:large subunit ribosomal protein L35